MSQLNPEQKCVFQGPGRTSRAATRHSKRESESGVFGEMNGRNLHVYDSVYQIIVRYNLQSTNQYMKIETKC